MGTNLPPLDDDFGLGYVAARMRANMFRGPRFALALVGGLMIGFAANNLWWITEYSEFYDSIRSSEIAIQRLVYYSTIGIGAILLGCSAMIYRYPLACTLGGLIVMVLGTLAAAFIEPATLDMDFFMRLAVIVVLVNGVRTAIVYSKELKLEEEKHRALATAIVISE